MKIGAGDLTIANLEVPLVDDGYVAGGGLPWLRLHPIETYSQEIDPDVRVSSDGTVEF